MSLNYRLYDNTSQKMYNFVRGFVIGNVLENPLLLTNEDMLFERRSMVERRKRLRNFRERRTSEESIVN